MVYENGEFYHESSIIPKEKTYYLDGKINKALDENWRDFLYDE